MFSTILMASLADIFGGSVLVPVLLLALLGLGIYVLYVQRGGDPLDPFKPLKEGLDQLPPETGRPTLDRVFQLAAAHFKDVPGVVYLIHKEAEEVGAILGSIPVPVVPPPASKVVIP